MSDRASSPLDSLPAVDPDQIDQLLITLNRLALSGAFVSGLAHELNNPLQVVNGTVELLLARPNLDPEIKPKLERVANQVHRASNTIMEVLGFVRDRTTVPGRVDMRTVIEQVMSLRRYPLTRRGINPVVTPPEAGTAILHARPVEIAQILLNLVMNAEAVLAERDGAELQVSCTVEDGYVRIVVADNGPGISDEVSARLFEPFFTSRGHEVAAGLGLAAAAALVRRNKGRIWHEPTPSGAVFIVELPLKAA